MMKLLQICFLVNLMIVSMALLHGNSGTLLSARCRSRCLAQEIQKQNVTLVRHVPCTSHTCLSCLKPCKERKTKSLSCSWLCGLHSTAVEIKRICQESCKFLKHTLLEDGNSTSCPDGVSNNECVLVRPENVEVHVPERNKKPQNYTISWNTSTTLPSSTVFVVMAKKQQKGALLVANTTNDWTEIKQTTLHSVKVNLQPLFWYQFKVAAVNKYGASSFSVPSRFIFANPRSPGPPREFKVTAMQAVKDHVQVNLAWKKPINSIGLPIHRYRVSWSIRPDNVLDKFISLEVTDKRLQGNTHEYTIRELLPNKTYVLELRAISRWRNQRLRSQRVTLTIRTPVLEEAKEDTVKKKPSRTKVVVTKGNSLFKKTVSKETKVSMKPTTFTVRETSPTNRSSARPPSALTPGNVEVSRDVKEQKSIAGINRVSWLMLSTLVALVATLICFLR